MLLRAARTKRERTYGKGRANAAPGDLRLRRLGPLSSGRGLAPLDDALRHEGHEGEEGEEPAYQPACDIRGITVKNVLDVLERSGAAELPFNPAGEVREIADILDAFGETIGRSPENRLITDL